MASLTIEIGSADVQNEVVALESGVTSLGRIAGNTILLDDPAVSRRHAEIRYDGQVARIADLGSANGTWVNGTELEPRVERTLQPGDLIEIGNFSLKLSVYADATSTQVMQHTVTIVSRKPAVLRITLPDGSFEVDLVKAAYTLGRSADNDIVVDVPAVSKHHARLESRDGTFEITDLGSTNGILLNGQPVQTQLLSDGAVLQIAGAVTLEYRATESPAAAAIGAAPVTGAQPEFSLDAIGLKRIVANGVTILHDMSMSIQSQEFVAIVGPSGAGKSTLINALCGYQQATEGSVLINGSDLYAHLEDFRSDLGFVPQEDIIHRELNIRRAFEYAGRLRMPAGTKPFERQQRIREVLEELDLTPHAGTPVRQLSGGQRKRVSIGVELLTRPNLLFLDEATSGLDPGIETQMMRLFRHLADNGRIVILVTHATKNVMICDKVAFMARGGYLAFYGPPDEALTYFGTKDFDDIYTRLEEKTGQEWGEAFAASDPRPAPTPKNGSGAAPRVARQSPGLISGLKQFLNLTARSLEILLRSPRDLAVLLLLAPFLGSLNFVVWNRDLFHPLTGDASTAMMLFFMVTIVTLLVGSLGSVREIVKEQAVYKRERMVALQLMPYIASKVTVGLAYAFYSGLMLFLLTSLAVDFSYLSLQERVQLFVPFFLCTMSGVALGLLVSAAAPTEERAMMLITGITIPQFLLSGGLLPIKNLGGIGPLLTLPATAKWALAAMITTAQVKVGACVSPDLSDCRIPGLDGLQSAIEKQSLLHSLDKNGAIFDVNVPLYWGAMVLIIGIVTLLIGILQKRKDA